MTYTNIKPIPNEIYYRKIYKMPMPHTYMANKNKILETIDDIIKKIMDDLRNFLKTLDNSKDNLPFVVNVDFRKDAYEPENGNNFKATIFYLWSNYINDKWYFKCESKIFWTTEINLYDLFKNNYKKFCEIDSDIYQQKDWCDCISKADNNWILIENKIEEDLRELIFYFELKYYK
ncbi:MAG: hypothetical protein FWC41_04340 [Firmicutes bacterium]|nr:hypothetical protein [Bacillota bacterium]